MLAKRALRSLLASLFNWVAHGNFIVHIFLKSKTWNYIEFDVAKRVGRTTSKSKIISWLRRTGSEGSLKIISISRASTSSICHHYSANTANSIKNSISIMYVRWWRERKYEKPVFYSTAFALRKYMITNQDITSVEVRGCSNINSKLE